jgi:colicin import membrane protein
MLDTPHKKKSAGLTAVIAILILLLFFMLGLTYYDPPISYGMEVNFGTLAAGRGPVQPLKNTQTNEQAEEQPVVEEEVISETSEAKTQESAKEVLTEEESSVVIPEEKVENKKAESTPEQTEPEQVPAEKVPPKVSETTKSVVSNLLNNKTEEGEEDQGEGTDLVAGDKGKLEGNLYSSSYYNNNGLGGRGKGYGLNGRSLQSSGKVVQDCNQEGTVVVRITVNTFGDVIQAEPGIKGTTNTHPCLLEPARKTALLHKWFPDSKAPAEQIGYVVIQFKLGE